TRSPLSIAAQPRDSVRRYSMLHPKSAARGGSNADDDLRRRPTDSRAPWRMARHYWGTLSRLSTGEPGHSPQGGGFGVRRLLYAQPGSLPDHRDPAAG